MPSSLKDLLVPFVIYSRRRALLVPFVMYSRQPACRSWKGLVMKIARPMMMICQIYLPCAQQRLFK